MTVVVEIHTCLKFRDDHLLLISMFITATHANRKQQKRSWLMVKAGQQLDRFTFYSSNAIKKKNMD